MDPKRILLVEDNEDEAALIRWSIERTCPSTEITVLNSGSEALEYITRYPAGHGGVGKPPLNLIILDINLPGASGLEVLDHIRSRLSLAFIPVVVLTASEDPDDLRLSYEKGANGFIRKTGDGREFNRRMVGMADFWLNVNVPLHHRGGGVGP